MIPTYTCAIESQVGRVPESPNATKKPDTPPGLLKYVIPALTDPPGMHHVRVETDIILAIKEIIG